MLKGLMNAMSNSSKSPGKGLMGGVKKPSTDASDVKNKVFGKADPRDIELPLSGSSKPEHQELMRRRRGFAEMNGSAAKKSEPPQKKGLLARLADMNPIARAASSSSPK